MHEEKHQLKVFLCHAHSDKSKVRELYYRLKADGVDAWLDKEKLLPGQDWEYEIRKAVRESDVVVVCLSKQFNERGFRQNEVRIALKEADSLPDGEIFIIPARLEDCENLESLSKWHWVNLFEDDGYERLMRALQLRADKVSATLQAKRGWLPKVSRPGRLTEKAISEIKSLNSNSTYIKEEEKQAGNVNLKSKEVTPSITKEKNWVNKASVFAFIGIVGIIIIGLLNLPLAGRILAPELTITIIPATPTSTSPTNTPFPTRTRVPLPSEIKDGKGGIDVEMVLVPAGEFVMGSNNGKQDERPVHNVFLPDYYIDRYEVTNAFYKACVDKDECIQPVKSNFEDIPRYFGNDVYKDFPVVHVTWEMALSYCEWRGTSLPTEAEWEKAARGFDERTFPWGNEFDGMKANSCDFSCDSANRNSSFDDGYRYTSPAGSFPNGASPYGALDLAGNVWEWIAGEYRDNYIFGPPIFFNVSLNYTAETPVPDKLIARGGSWFNSEDLLRSSYRAVFDQDYQDTFVGFRCVREVGY